MTERERADSDTGTAGPLAGIRVLEVGHMLAGPYATMMLADLGADVTKIEPPGGDISRQVGETYFASLNRGKRSVCLDLGTESGQRSLGELATRSHALLVNLKPSGIRRLGLTYEALRARNERIVCVALTGYGLDGGDDPAFDYLIQAATGVASLTGDPDAPPTLPGYSSADNSAGLTAALGLLAMIVAGRGGQVDIAMRDVMLSQLNYRAAAYLNGGTEPRRLPFGAHSYYVPAQLFPTAEGYLALFITHDRFWRAFAAEAGIAGFATMAERAASRDEVLAVVTKSLGADSAANWERRLKALGVPAARVRTLPQALDEAADAIVTAGGFRLVTSPVRVAGYEPAYREPPDLGEHGSARLARNGGSSARIDYAGWPMAFMVWSVAARMRKRTRPVAPDHACFGNTSLIYIKSRGTMTRASGALNDDDVKAAPAAHATGLNKTYGSGQAAVHALADVNVTFERGRFTAVMGPSGSGKSTLMHCMAGLDRPTSGQVYVGGQEIGKLDDSGLTKLRRDRIGFVFQSFNLVPTLTAAENITLPLSLAGTKVDKEWFGSLVEQLGIGDRLNHRPSQLSGGQQQRVACARALITRPDLIFADEPTGNLDSNASADLLAFLKGSVREMGQSIVMVTHDPRGAAYADRVIFLADGTVVGELDKPTADSVLERMRTLGS